MTVSICPKALRKFSNAIEKEIKAKPDIIYHYTSPSSLLSIIKNKEIWFSDVNFLNDETENSYIYLSLKEFIDSNKQLYNQNFCKYIEEFCDDCINDDGLFNVLYQKTYISSFSISKDSLNLWNYYTKNDNHIGYNIGLDTQKFIKYSNEGDLLSLQGKVIYGNEFLYLLFEKLLNDIYKKFLTIDITYQSMLRDELFFNFNRYSMFFKDKHFESEQEYRLVWVTDINAKLREFNGFYIPYQIYTIPARSIKSIIISPTQNHKIATLGVKKLVDNYLEKYEKEIKIEISKIPLRY